MSALGRHILVEYQGCNEHILDDVPVIEQAMVKAAQDAGATVINSTFHHFSPYGVSGVVVIQESHLAIHTWPEYRYAAVDIFTCGDGVDPWKAYDVLLKAFEAAHGNAMDINRGSTDLLKRIDFKIVQTELNGKTQTRPTYKRNVWLSDKDENIALSFRHSGDILYRQQSPYQLVEVFDSYAFGKMLTIDRVVMCTEKDEFVYHEMITHVPMHRHVGANTALVIGGGDGGTVRELLRHKALDQVTMVEIDARVVEASKLHLPHLASAFDHPKLQLLFYDGIKYTADCTANTYDLIIVDSCDPQGPSEGLFTAAFYKDAYRCLRDNGILCIQSEGPYYNPSVFREINQCLKGVFGASKVYVYFVHIPTYPTGMWSFTLCTKGEIRPYTDEVAQVAEAFSDQHQLKYYNADMHQAAFALPPFVKELIANEGE